MLFLLILDRKIKRKLTFKYWQTFLIYWTCLILITWVFYSLNLTVVKYLWSRFLISINRLFNFISVLKRNLKKALHLGHFEFSQEVLVPSGAIFYFWIYTNLFTEEQDLRSNYQYLIPETGNSGSGISVGSEFLSPDLWRCRDEMHRTYSSQDSLKSKYIHFFGFYYEVFVTDCPKTHYFYFFFK